METPPATAYNDAYNDARAVQRAVQRIERICACIQTVAFNPDCLKSWNALESLMREWRGSSPDEEYDSDFVDDNLDVILSSNLLSSVYHVSRLTPEAHSKRCILMAKSLCDEIVTAIERAAIVARIGRRSSRSPSWNSSWNSSLHSSLSSPMSPLSSPLSPKSPMLQSPKCK